MKLRNITFLAVIGVFGPLISPAWAEEHCYQKPWPMTGVICTHTGTLAPSNPTTASTKVTTFRVTLPVKDAKLYFDDRSTDNLYSEGTSRTFLLDPVSSDGTVWLQAGQDYVSNFRAVVNVDGQNYEDILQVDYFPGDTIDITFQLHKDAQGQVDGLTGSYERVSP